MTAINEPDDWRSLGACASADPDLFFPVSSAGAGQRQEEEARAFCGRCQVCPQCLAFALATSQAHGVWGGTTEDERRRLREAEHRAGAAPRQAAAGNAGRGMAATEAGTSLPRA
jgi:WhiB family transcriptional regulator, redox-sensing transcriptional regulator